MWQPKDLKDDEKAIIITGSGKNTSRVSTAKILSCHVETLQQFKKYILSIAAFRQGEE